MCVFMSFVVLSGAQVRVPSNPLPCSFLFAPRLGCISTASPPYQHLLPSARPLLLGCSSGVASGMPSCLLYRLYFCFSAHAFAQTPGPPLCSSPSIYNTDFPAHISDHIHTFCTPHHPLPPTRHSPAGFAFEHALPPGIWGSPLSNGLSLFLLM